MAFENPRLKPGATVLTPASPAVPRISIHLRARIDPAFIAASSTTLKIIKLLNGCIDGPRFAGEAGVRSVAPGFSRGFPSPSQSREPALAGDRKTPEARP